MLGDEVVQHGGPDGAPVDAFATLLSFWQYATAQRCTSTHMAFVPGWGSMSSNQPFRIPDGHDEANKRRAHRLMRLKSQSLTQSPQQVGADHAGIPSNRR